MDKNEIRKLISQSQDNNTLLKGYSEDDYLSKYIDESINSNDNVQDIIDDLSYAQKQIERAIKSIEKYHDQPLISDYDYCFEDGVFIGVGKFFNQFDEKHDPIKDFSFIVKNILGRDLYEADTKNIHFLQLGEMSKKAISLFNEMNAASGREKERLRDSFDEISYLMRFVSDRMISKK